MLLTIIEVLVSCFPLKMNLPLASVTADIFDGINVIVAPSTGSFVLSSIILPLIATWDFAVSENKGMNIYRRILDIHHRICLHLYTQKTFRNFYHKNLGGGKFFTIKPGLSLQSFKEE